MRRAEAEADASSARYRSTVLRVFVEVADALQAVANDDAEYRAQQSVSQLAQENLALARRAFELGGGTILQVLDAQRQNNAAHRALVAMEGRRLGNLARLRAATTVAVP